MTDPFAGIIGHEKAVARLRLALEHGFPHALLITGPRHVGKSKLAEAVASALLGVDDIKKHPDFRLVERQADPKTKKLKKGIAVDEVRAARDFLHLSASVGGRKVVLVREAELLSEEAGNALLKTLEEPPEGSHLILTATEPEAVLATIRSRAAQVALARVPEETIESALVKRGVAPTEAAERAALAAGRPGLALGFGLDADVLNWYRHEADRWRELKLAPLYRRFALIGDLAPPKADRETVVARLRDVADLWEAAEHRGLRHGLREAPTVLAALSHFRRDLAVNIQPRLLLERLMIEIDKSL